jgi:hypothetical protein
MEKLAIKAKDREAIEADGRYLLREPVFFYKPNFTFENDELSL